MSKRLQVLVDSKEYNLFKNMAKMQNLSLGEWVRVVLRQMVMQFSTIDEEKKIKNIRLASLKRYPTNDIDKILEEIERGYIHS